MDVNSENRDKIGFNCQIKYFMIMMVWAVFHCPCFAQYYPALKPMNRYKETELLLDLKNSKTNTDKAKLLLDISTFYFNKPFQSVSNLEKALHYAKKARELSTLLNYSSGYNDSQLLVADIFAEKGDMKSAERILTKVKDTTKINLLLMLSLKSGFSFFLGKHETFDKAIDFAEQARKLSIHLHQREKEINALKDIAAVHFYQDKFSLAERELLDVLKKYQLIGYPNVHYTYYLLAELNVQAGNLDKALFYSLETIKSMNATRDTVSAGDFYYILAFVYKVIGKHQLCIDYCKKAINAYKIHSGDDSLFEAVWLAATSLTKIEKNNDALAIIQQINKAYPPQNLADSLKVNESFAYYYKAEKKYYLSEKYYLKILRLDEKNNSVVVADYRNVGDVYVQDHKYAKAKPYLIKAWDFPNDISSVQTKSLIQFYLFQCDSAAGNYISAISHFQKCVKLRDSNMTISKNNAIQKLLIQNETEKKVNEIKIKDKDIRLLNQKDAVDQVNINRLKFIRNVTIVGVLSLLVIMGLLYFLYRQKKQISQVVIQKNSVITQKNDLLQCLVEEKELLLKEIHHRVKNNLHMVICLLESQSLYLENDALKAIDNSKNRIYAMSLIHQKLYQSEDIKIIDMAVYLPEFIHYLGGSFDVFNRIHFRLDVEPLKLSATQAIPLGLIINEAVTNSIKYAFPGKQTGEIKIQLHQTGKQIKLVIADNGIGMHPDIKDTELNSLGIGLMKGFSTEINGKIYFETKKGTTVTVIFGSDPLNDKRIRLTTSQRKTYT